MNFLSTYSYKKSCNTSTTLQTGIARFVSDVGLSAIAELLVSLTNSFVEDFLRYASPCVTVNEAMLQVAVLRRFRCSYLTFFNLPRPTAATAATATTTATA